MPVNDAIVERALEAIRALNRGEKEPRKPPEDQPAQPCPEPARGVCFHCGGVGRCNCVACDPPGRSLACKEWLQ